MNRRLSTGIEVLDRQLDGGLPPGSICAFCAPPASQSELLLYELTRARPTLYMTTQRTAQAVRDALERTRAPTGNPAVKYVSSDVPLENSRQLFQSVADEANVIIDPIDTLERTERNSYQKFLNGLQNHMHNIGGIAVVHCLSEDDEPPLRDTTKHMADVIFDLQVTVNGTDVESRLAVPKFRGGAALNETIKLELADRVRVDTSRDIA